MSERTIQLNHCRCTALDLLFQGVPRINHAFLLERPDGTAVLVECGPASTRAKLLAALGKAGSGPERVTDVLLTHIHLDHGGDAGWWARQGAAIHVHPSAVRHLVDPSRLVAGARALYGDRFDELWGEVTPVAEDRIRAVEDGGTVTDLGVVGWHSPGHARHHVAWELDGQMFTGDTAGARLPGSSYLSVTAAPPQFDPAAYDLTLERLAERDPQRLWLTHGGPFEDAGDHLRRYRRKVAGLFAEVKAWRHSGLDDAAVRERYHDRERRMAVDEGLTVKDWQAMELMNPTALSTDGMLLFLDRDSG